MLSFTPGSENVQNSFLCSRFSILTPPWLMYLQEVDDKIIDTIIIVNMNSLLIKMYMTIIDYPIWLM